MNNPMIPPPYSLLQCLDRLSPRARRKYDDLKALLADSEALQRSLMERAKVKEDRFVDLTRRRSYCAVPGGDAAEVAKLDGELAAVRADLGKLERERSKRNSVRGNVEQTVSRLNNFIGELFSGASEMQPPPWPVTVPGPHENESIADALVRLRHEISIARSELQQVRTAPPPPDEIRAALVAEVDRMASEGKPRIVLDGGRVTLNWLDVMQYAGPGGALSAPSGSASKLLAALFPEQIKQVLLDAVKDAPGGIPAAARPRLIGEAEARILALEIAEERLVVAALDEGLECHRRADANPWAVLYAEPEAAQAEAAE